MGWCINGLLYEEAKKRNVSHLDVEAMWNKYKQKVIISLQEKLIITDMLNDIKNYILNGQQV